MTTVVCEADLINLLERDRPDPLTASQVEADLWRALDNREFQVYYQPIVSLETSEIKGFEALVRWRHPSRGLLFPADFLPVSEATGLIVPIGLWVFREASLQMHQWHRRFPSEPLYLSVNISSKLFQQPDLVEQISQILNETGLNPATLMLEITETLVMQNSETARNILLQLRALNIRLAIDDFGTGYSSLSYLQKFPVHTLKIDQSFISTLLGDKESLEIVRAVITLAHNLGLDVIAEGIEADHHRALLKLLKCECGQGYFYSRAVDHEQARMLIDKGTLHAAIADLQDAAEPALSVKNAFDRRDDALFKDISSSVPGDVGTGSETDQKLREEFEIHIENLRKDAIKQFDQELYTVCLPNFEFLCELEPENRSLRDYLELSRQLTGKPAADSSKDYLSDAIGEVGLKGNDEKKHHSDLGRDSKVKKYVAFWGAIVSSALILTLSIQTLTPQGEQDLGSTTAKNDQIKFDAAKPLPASSAGITLSPELSTYTVIHDHLLKSCHGLLRINHDSIVFEPSHDKKHAFARKLSDIVGTERGETLKIRFLDQTYRFKTGSAKDGKDNLSYLRKIDQRLAQLRARSN